jgi:hypothetical protein
MAKKRISVPPQRFARLAKRLTKLHPASAAAKRLRPVLELELMRLLVTGGRSAAEKAIKGAKVGARRWEKAQRTGAIAKWRTTIGLGMQALEIWLLFSKVMKGTTVKYEAVRPARASAKRPSRRTSARRRAR